MDVEFWLPWFITAGSLTVAVISLVANLRASRGKWYLESAKGLQETEDLLLNWGPPQGSGASSGAAEAHARTLSRIEKEKRLAASFYLDAVGRLSRPGSLLNSSVLIFYGVFMFVLLLNGAFEPANQTGEARQVAGYLQWAWLILASALFIAGVGQGVRRIRTRGRVQNVGLVDVLSKEGMRQQKEEVMTLGPKVMGLLAIRRRN